MRDYKIKSDGEITDLDIEKRIVTGYAAKFGNVDLHGDMIMPGAFSKTIKERGVNGKNEIWFLHDHDSSKPLGKPQVLKEDSFGLYFEAKIVDTEIGEDILKLYEEGLINQHSIGFSTIKEEKVEPKNKNPYYEIQEVKLYEFSSVLWAANPDTPFLGLKSLDAKDLSDRFEKLYKMLRKGNLKDESYELLEIEYNFIKSEIFKLINGREKSEIITTPEIVNPEELIQKQQLEFLQQLKNSFK
jgi:HK97 family phage prohead protease